MKPTYPFTLLSSASLASILALVLTHAAAQTPPATLVLTETNNGSIVQAVVRQPISIHLRGNPSTPYLWDLVSTNGASVLTNGPTDFIPDSPGLPGSAGTFEFPFIAVDAGATTLDFAEHLYGNPQDVISTFQVTIEVVVPGPVLTLALDGTDVLLTWPNTISSAYNLEGTLNLDPPRWAALNVLVQDDGQHFWVRLPHAGPSLYFRLHRL